MVRDRFDDPLAGPPIESESVQDLLTHLGSNPRVVGEQGPASGVPGGRLADVVQESGKGQAHGGLRQERENLHGVSKNVSLGMVFFALLHALHRRHFRQYGRKQPVPIEQSQALSRMRTGEDSNELVSYALPADRSNLEGAIFDGLTRSLLDLES